MPDKLPPIQHQIDDADAPGVGRCCTFDELKERAYEKADTGRFENWQEVGAAVEIENCPDAAKRLRADPILTTMLDTRCWQARHPNA